MTTRIRPRGRPVRTLTQGGVQYRLYRSGDLWTAGKYGYYVGLVSDPDNLEIAVDTHTLELQMLAAEFDAVFEQHEQGL